MFTFEAVSQKLSEGGAASIIRLGLRKGTAFPHIKWQSHRATAAGSA